MHDFASCMLCAVNKNLVYKNIGQIQNDVADPVPHNCC